MQKHDVEAIMTSEPISVGADDALGSARDEMRRSGVGHLPVVDGAGAVVGILSQHDLLGFQGPDDAPVRDLMSDDVVSVEQGTLAHEAAYLMLRERIGCLPVVNQRGELVGIVTSSDMIAIAYRALGGAVPLDRLLGEEHEAENL